MNASAQAIRESKSGPAELTLYRSNSAFEYLAVIWTLTKINDSTVTVGYGINVPENKIDQPHPQQSNTYCNIFHFPKDLNLRPQHIP